MYPTTPREARAALAADAATASTPYLVKHGTFGVRLYSQRLIDAICCDQYQFRVSGLTLRALSKLAEFAATNPLYYTPIDVYRKLHPESASSLAEYAKAYGTDRCCVFDLSPDEAFIAEVEQLVDYFEHGAPNPVMAEQTLPTILSASRAYHQRRHTLTIAGAAYTTADELTRVGNYRLVRLITALSASTALDYFYAEDAPAEAVAKLQRFKLKELLLFALLDDADTVLVLFEADKQPNTPPLDILELPADKAKLRYYVLTDGAHQTPKKASERALHVAEIRENVPAALDYLHSLGLAVGMQEFCQTRSGKFSYVSSNPADPYAVFLDVRITGANFALPAGYTHTQFRHLTVTAAKKVLLPRVDCERADFAMCDAVTVETMTADSVTITGGEYGPADNLRQKETAVRGVFNAAHATFSDVKFNGVTIKADNLTLRAVRGMRQKDEHGNRLLRARVLNLTLAEQPNMANWYLPDTFELSLNTFDSTPVVLLDVSRQFPNVRKLTLATGAMGQPITTVPEVEITAPTGMPVPDIDAETVYALVNGAWHSLLKTKTLRIQALPLQGDAAPYDITVPPVMDLMYAGAERLLTSRAFNHNVLICPDDLREWAGAELVCPNIYLVWHDKLTQQPLLDKMLRQFLGNINLILDGADAVVPDRTLLPGHVKVWRVAADTDDNRKAGKYDGFDVRSWRDFHHLRGELRPA